MLFIPSYTVISNTTKRQMRFCSISRKTAAEFKDPLHKKLEFLRDRIFSDCPHVGKNGENISTNHELCEEILGHLGDLSGKDVLVWFNPEFFFKIRDKYPNANVTLISGSSKASIAGFFDKFGPNVSEVILVNPFNLDEIKKRINGMKFDVVIGNPPYQKSSDDSSFTNLWADFVHIGFQLLTDSGLMAMITPKTWGNQVTKENSSSRVFDLIKKYGTVVNIDECRKHFPTVGSSFSYYILDKEKTNSTCRIITDRSDLEISWADIFFIPNDFNLTTIKIISKLLSEKMFEYVSSSGTIGDISDSKDDDHIYSVRYAMGTEKWSDTQHKFQNVPKLVFPNQTSKNYPIYAPHSAPANRGVFYVVEDESHADRMLSYFRSKVIQFLISEQRTHHGVLNTQVIQQIPKIDTSRIWTDKELYDHFNLSLEERLHIDPSYKD